MAGSEKLYHLSFLVLQIRVLRHWVLGPSGFLVRKKGMNPTFYSRSHTVTSI